MKLDSPQAAGALGSWGFLFRILRLPDNAVGGFTHTSYTIDYLRSTEYCTDTRPRQLSHDRSGPH